MSSDYLLPSTSSRARHGSPSSLIVGQGKYVAENGTNGRERERLQVNDVLHSSNGLGSEHRLNRPSMTFSSIQATLLAAVINHFQKNLKDDDHVLSSMENNKMFQLFYEEQYHRTKKDLAKTFQESARDCSAPHVVSFILSILHRGRFSVPELLISMFYLSRFRKRSKISLHAGIWRPLFLTALLIADKVWQDHPVRNSDLTKLFPVLDNAELKRLEYYFIATIEFDVLVTPRSFREFCERLLDEKVHPEIREQVRHHEYIKTLCEKGDMDVPIPLHEDQIFEDRTGDHESSSITLQPQLAQSPRAASFSSAAKSPGPSRLAIRTPMSPSGRGLLSDVQLINGTNSSATMSTDEAIRSVVASPSPTRSTAMGTSPGSKFGSFGSPSKSSFGATLNGSGSKAAILLQSSGSPQSLKNSLGSSSVKNIFATPTSPGSGVRGNIGSARVASRQLSPHQMPQASPNSPSRNVPGGNSATAISAASAVPSSSSHGHARLADLPRSNTDPLDTRADSQREDTNLSLPNSTGSSVASQGAVPKSLKAPQQVGRSDPHAMSFQEKQQLFSKNCVRAIPTAQVIDTIGRPSSAPPGSVAALPGFVRPTATAVPSTSTARSYSKTGADLRDKLRQQEEEIAKLRQKSPSTNDGLKSSLGGYPSLASNLKSNLGGRTSVGTGLHASCAPPPSTSTSAISQVNGARSSSSGTTQQANTRSTFGGTPSNSARVNNVTSTTRRTIGSTPVGTPAATPARVGSLTASTPSGLGAPAPPVSRQHSNAFLSNTARGRSTSPAFLQDPLSTPSMSTMQNSARHTRGLFS